MPASRKNSTSTSAGYAANMDGVAAVDRALSIIEVLERARQPLTLTEVAEATDLYKSAVLRIMVSLERRALVVRRQDQRYLLGPLAFRLGQAFESSLHLEERLSPLLRALVDQKTESPSFHVLHDHETRLCLMRIDSNHSTLDRIRAGDLLPLKRGAAGKVLQQSVPPSPIADPLTLLRTSFGEREPSCAAIAGPVYGAGGELLGALSLSGPLERFTDASVKRMTKLLLEACETATHDLGGKWPVVRSGSLRVRR